MTVNMPTFDPTLLALIIPLIVIQLAMMILAIVDLLRDDRAVRGGSKAVWAVIIVFINLIGPILYFIVGREEGPVEPKAPGPGAMPGWGSPNDPPLVGSAAPPAAPPTMAPTEPSVTPVTAPVTAPAAASSPAAARPAAAPGAAAPLATRTDDEALTPAIPGDASAAITIEGLSKRYRTGLLALDQLSMVVPEGSVFGLLGPNGAGKTTTLRLIAGLTRPTAGRVQVDGTTVAIDPLEVRRRLGYLEQDPRGYGWMTGREQLRMLGRLHALDGAELDRAVDDVLGRVDLTEAADRRVGTYSGGMRQRLGIAGALVHRPPVIVLDEPVSALDPEGRRDVLNLMAALRGTTTVLFSTHVLADVERICDRVGILDRGQLVVEGPLAQLLDRYALPVYRIEPEPGQGAALERLAASLRAQAWVTDTSVDHGLLTVAVADPAVAARELLPTLAAASLAVVSVARARPTLEDVFLRLTGNGREVAA